MDMNFIKTLNGEKTKTLPVWFMRQAGRYLPEYLETRKQAGDFLSLCYTPDLASEVTLQPIRRFDFDAAIIFSDILVVPHALGQNVWFEAGEGPRLDAIKTVNDLPEFNKDKFLSHLEPVFEALRLTRKSLSPEKALIGFAGSPWTLACYMVNGQGSRDYQNVRSYALQHPEIFQDIIDLLVDSISLYLIEKVKSGANALQLFDSWCGVLSVEEFDRWVIQPTARIVQNIRAVYPNIPVIGFPRLAGHLYQNYVDQTGIQGVSVDSSIPLSEIQKLQNKVCVQGNIDPLLLLKGGQDMVDQALKICDALSDKPFIFNLAHGIIKETNPDHVALLVETVRNYKEKVNSNG